MALNRITINDVAKEAGVHRSTVSRALTGSGPVSPVNRERVFAAVKKLNYHPNTLAGALKSKKRNTWGLLSFWNCTPNSMDHFYAKTMGALLDQASRIGYKMLIRNFEGDFGDNPETISFCHDAQLGGLVLLAPRCKDEALASLKELDTPAVLLAYRPDKPGFHYVDLDNKSGAKKMTEHLVSLGHRRIAFIGGELELSSNARDRYAGYQEGLSAAGIAEEADLVRNRDFDPAYARQMAKELLELPEDKRPTAIFCATDMMAAAAVEASMAKGLKVPQDLSVAGFDNNPTIGYEGPRLTTIHFPFYEAAVMAAGVLRELENEDNPAPREILLSADLVQGESTAAPKS